jgi:hypothetical protein
MWREALIGVVVGGLLGFGISKLLGAAGGG